MEIRSKGLMIFTVKVTFLLKEEWRRENAGLHQHI